MDSSDEQHENDLYDGRVEWARERTLLAKERTYAAWVRTGLGVAGMGVAVPRVLGEVSARLTGVVGVLLLLSAAAVHLFAYRSARRTFVRLRAAGLVGVPPWTLALLTTVLVFADLALVVLALGY